MNISTTNQTEHWQQAKLYKRSIASRYRALRQHELSELPEGPLHVSPKVDGELWFVSISAGSLALIAPNGREIQGDVPLLDELKKTIGTRTKDTLIAGELFAAGGQGRPRVGDVSAALSDTGDAKRLGYQAFDVVLHDGIPAPVDYAERYALLESLFAGGKRAKAIKTFETTTSEVEALYTELVDSGKAEGLVARAPDGRIFKIKPAFHIDCVVIGFTLRQAAPTQVRSLLLGLVRPDGTTQVVGACGNLGTDAQRESLYARLSDTVVDSRFRRVSGSGAMYQLVRPALVVEIVTTDVQAHDSAGEPLMDWALSLDNDAGWSPITRVHSASLIHPVLERIREDKSVNGTDVRVSQLTERCLPLGLDDPASAAELPKSEVVRREAYSKTSKGALAVRKLVVWQTNKDTIDSAYPAFVVHFTDYSAARRAPIKREVRLATTADDANRIADSIIAKQIKKGWARY